MTDKELLAKIKAEIERQLSDKEEIGDLGGMWALQDVLSFLDTLEESEKPMNQEGLEEEIDRFEDWMETYNQADYPTSITTRDIARHFAEWGAEHLKRQIMAKYIDAEEITPIMAEYVADVFSRKEHLDDISYGYCTEIADVFRRYAERAKQEQQEKSKKDCNDCPHCVDRKDQYGWHFKGCFGGPYKGKFIAEIDECPLKQAQPEVNPEKPIIPNDLEEAADEMALRAFPEKKSYSTVIDRVVDYNAVDRKNYRDGIIAGAKWQADHTPLPEDTVLFNKGVEEGKRLMMEEAVECELYYDGDFLAIDLNMAELGYSERDKVRIIVLKNTEKQPKPPPCTRDEITLMGRV